MNPSVFHAVSSFMASPNCELEPWKYHAGVFNAETVETTGMLSPSCIWMEFNEQDWTEQEEDRSFALENNQLAAPSSTSSANVEQLDLMGQSRALLRQNSGMTWDYGSFQLLMDETGMIINRIKGSVGSDLLEIPSTEIMSGEHKKIQSESVQVISLGNGPALPSPTLDEDDVLEQHAMKGNRYSVCKAGAVPLSPLKCPQQPSLPNKSSRLAKVANPWPQEESLGEQNSDVEDQVPSETGKVDFSESPPIELIVKLLGEDGKWRKYGRKMMKDCPYPAHYYKCTIRGCGAKRKVWYNENGELKVFGKGSDHSHGTRSAGRSKGKGAAQALLDMDSSQTLQESGGHPCEKNSAGRRNVSSTAESVLGKRKQKALVNPRAEKTSQTWPRQPNPSWRFREASTKEEACRRSSKQSNGTEGKEACKGEETSESELQAWQLGARKGGYGRSKTVKVAARSEQIQKSDVHNQGDTLFSKGEQDDEELQTWMLELMGEESTVRSAARHHKDQAVNSDSKNAVEKSRWEPELEEWLESDISEDVREREIAADSEYLIFHPNMLWQPSWQRMGDHDPLLCSTQMMNCCCTATLRPHKTMMSC